MISSLQIKNIGIINDLSINLNEGLNILTGETGAGKTLIIDSLGIISGERFSKEMIRKGQDYSYVEACIYWPENKIAIDGNIIVSREIYTNGRNMCKINGRMVTVNELKAFMEDIIDIHGQHDNQQLLNPRTHIVYLDQFGAKEIERYKNEYVKLYEEYQQVKTELKNNYGDEKEKQRKLDLLKYQLNEIQAANLKMGEDEKLEADRKIILNAEKINENLSTADSEISEHVLDSMNQAIRSLEKIENLDQNYAKSLNALKSTYYDLQEISRDIMGMRENIFFDEEQRQKLEMRLDTIFSLKRKYGNSIEEILMYQKELEKEVEQIENIEEYNQKRKEKLKHLTSQMYQLSETLNQLRKKYALELEQKINKELQDLEMKNASIEIKIDWNEKEEYNSNGLDTVEIFIKTNIGEDAKPLYKIASGGEMSRIMLAIKNVLSNVDHVPILIFDEIDTGISGKAAKSVGEKLKSISKYHQVLCVTHLATIAAKGDYNYYIFKKVENDKTTTHVQLLSEEETLTEIARIASGEVTEISLQHARELRK